MTVPLKNKWLVHQIGFSELKDKIAEQMNSRTDDQNSL